ncbi:MAG: PQQ-binding-like beta-propeller repeat protein, partial [Pseudomonadota bacterium]
MRVISGLLFVLLSGLGSHVFGEDWPQWFGPQRDGIWHESGVLRKFPADGPEVLWRAPVNVGYSGPAVSQGRVFLTDRSVAAEDAPSSPQGIAKIPGQERVVCLDAETGRPIWEHSYDCEYEISYPEGPRTTPTVDGDRVYTLGAMGDLICFDVETGNVIWSKQLMEEYEFVRPLIWGWSASPLIDGDHLICLVGGKEAGVVAFDKHDGKEIWRAIDAKEIGYAPPTIYEADGQRQLIVWHDVAVQGLDPATGKRLWRIAFPEDGEVMRPAAPIVNPLVFDNRVLVSDFYNGSLLLELSSDPPDAEPLWISPKATAVHRDSLNTLMATPVIHEGYIYGIAGNGELRCLKADTGEVVWRSLEPIGGKVAMFGTIFIIPNEDHWFLVTDQGELIIAKLSPDGYEEIDRARLLEPV